MAGKKYLKVTGVLMIIIGILGVLFYGLAIAGIGTAASLGLAGAKIAGLLTAGMAIYIIWSVIEIIAGIFGVKFCENKEKAGACMTLGYILIALNIISAVLSFIGGAAVVNCIVTLIYGIIIPGFYIYGARLNTRAASN